jgi:DNA-binding MarR family transcriptional regulator
MRVLYKRTDKEVPEDFIPYGISLDIMTNWKPNYNLFSITQIADRNHEKRGHVQRQVNRLIKLGLVARYVKPG